MASDVPVCCKEATHSHTNHPSCMLAQFGEWLIGQWMEWTCIQYEDVCISTLSDNF